MLIFAIAVLCLSLVYGASVPKVEAILDDFVPGGGKDGGDQVRMRYTNETLANMPLIMATRVQDLVALYCGQLNADLALFAQEHGPAFGVTNVSHPNGDAYDVAQRVLMVLETIDGFPVVSEAAAHCREGVGKQHARTAKRQHALWIVVCMYERQERVGDRFLSVFAQCSRPFTSSLSRREIRDPGTRSSAAGPCTSTPTRPWMPWARLCVVFSRLRAWPSTRLTQSIDVTV